MFYRIILIWLSLVIGQITAYAQENLSISAEAFGMLPDIANVQISPDGSKILLLKNIGGKMAIVTRSLDGERPENIIPNEDGIYNWAIWASNDKILASIRFAGHENRSLDLKLKVQTRLISMTWDGKNIKNANRFKSWNRAVSRFNKRQPQFQDRIIDILKDDPDHILIQLDIDRVGEPGVYKLNINTGKRTSIIKGRRNVEFWVTDKDHIVRYGEGTSEQRGGKEVRRSAYYRGEADAPWITLFEYDELSGERPFYFEGFSEDPNIIYITGDNENNVRSLYRYDVKRGQRIEQIAGDGQTDIVDVAIGEDLKLDYYAYYRNKPKVIRLTERGNRFDKITAELFPDQAVDIASESKDKSKLIIDVSSPTVPVAYYYLDMDTKNIQEIGRSYRNIDRSKLSDKAIISYIARDGLEISGYLSVPKNSSGQNLPTIIMPHGGPMSRDEWNFDYWVQFLTTRGYAVLQMNYRGSTGYGEKFRLLGYHEWGRKMLHDINDGTRFMIEQGIADPDNICILGASYGGYAALQSIVMDEFDYKCAVAFAPVTHLPGLIQNFKGARGYRSYKNYIESDDWTLEAASPSFHTDRFDVPVLVIQGTKDLNVPANQSRGFFERMNKENKDIRYVELEGGDHFLSNEEHRITFLKEIENFVGKHLH